MPGAKMKVLSNNLKILCRPICIWLYHCQAEFPTSVIWRCDKLTFLKSQLGTNLVCKITKAVSTENTVPPRFTKSRNWNSSGYKFQFLGTNSNQNSIWICTARYRGIWVSRCGGFRGWSISSGNCHIDLSLRFQPVSAYIPIIAL